MKSFGVNLAGRPLAIIPARNEATRIVPVITGLRLIGLPVLVIDDGSHDGTAVVARNAGAQVLIQRHGGKGAAMLAGCRWACAHGFRRVLLIDGDGQHDPGEAGRLMAAGARGADLVIGKRIIDRAAQPLHRRAINRLSSLLVTLVAGRRVIDSQSGYRLCAPELLLRLPLRGRHYDLETEMCVQAARSGVRVVEVPITTIYHDKRSGVRPVVDSLRFVRAVLRSATTLRGRRITLPTLVKSSDHG